MLVYRGFLSTPPLREVQRCKLEGLTNLTRCALTRDLSNSPPMRENVKSKPKKYLNVRSRKKAAHKRSWRDVRLASNALNKADTM
ncbi:MAG: hypothetical protein QW494_08765 [Metallosphaera sp.]